MQDRILVIGTVKPKGLTTIYLESAKEVKTFVSQYSFIDHKRLFISDVSLLTANVLSYLLKFVEETSNHIILHASKDNIPPVFLSRFQRVIKRKDFKVGMSTFAEAVFSLHDNEQFSSARLLSVSANYYCSYVRYMLLPRGIQERVGELL